MERVEKLKNITAALESKLDKLTEKIRIIESGAITSGIEKIKESAASDRDDTLNKVAHLSDSLIEQSLNIAKQVNHEKKSSPPEKNSTEEKSPIESPVIVSKPVTSDQLSTRHVAHRSVPHKPVLPKEPSFVDEIIKKAWSWFTDGNVFVRVGVIILFMGMTFLIRYAIGENMIPIELRLAAVAAAAITMLYWGWRQRNIRQQFSLVVQGGGIGLLYLTIFAGFSLYHVIPSPLAFVFLLLTVIFAAMLSILQNARPLALFATVGGFLAPVLTSTGSNNYIGLFSYYTFLNLGIFSIAWFKSWRILNLVGFLFTFVISTTWGVLSYKSEYFSTTEPFLIIFFLLYVGIGILFAQKRTKFYKDYVDSSLIFGTPVIAFGLQCSMVKDFEYGVAISAFSMAAFYISLAQYIWNKNSESLRLLAESFVSLGVIFATLAIPFAIDGTLTGASWAIEGVGILWISIKQQQKYRRLFGIALMFAAGLILASELIMKNSDFEYAFANAVFIGCFIIAVAASLGSWLISRAYDGKIEIENTLSTTLLLYGLFVLFAGFEYQIKGFSMHHEHGVLLAILSGLCVLAYTVAGNKVQWKQASWVSLVCIVPMGVAAALSYAYQSQLSVNYGYIIWPASLLIYFYGLKKLLNVIPQKPLLMAHASAAVIIVCLLFWDGIWQLMLCYSLLAVVFNQLAKQQWPQLKLLALGFLPVLVLCSMAAISVDGNLVDLSSLSADFEWSFPPGYILWPFGFAVYFYLLHQNPKIGVCRTSNMHYAGAALIYVLLFWLGVWPLLLAVSLLSVLCGILWLRYTWEEMYFTSMALLPLMFLVALISVLNGSMHPFYLQDFNLNLRVSAELGYILWPIAFMSLYWCYKKYDVQNKSANYFLHGASLVLLVLLITWEVSWHILENMRFMNVWHITWLPITAMFAVAVIIKLDYWPFTEHRDAYNRMALPVMLLMLVAWSFLQFQSSANSLIMPWIPILNPIDIVQAIIIMGLFLLMDKFKSLLDKKIVVIAVVTYVFLWANIDLLRAVHHWAHVPWRWPRIFNADISQTVLSLFWALSGLLVTLYSSRKKERALWIAGATLLGVVVLKLFLIDLSARETVERIVSFTGVGLLLMMVGYFSPLPPKKLTVTEGA